MYTSPSLSERLLRCFSYLFTASVGVYTVFHIPTNLTNELGGVAAFVWAVFMLAGIPAAWFAYRMKYRGEYVTLALMSSALLVAVLSGWFHTVDDFTIIPRVAVASALVCGYATRWVTLHRLTKSLLAQK